MHAYKQDWKNGKKLAPAPCASFSSDLCLPDADADVRSAHRLQPAAHLAYADKRAGDVDGEKVDRLDGIYMAQMDRSHPLC